MTNECPTLICWHSERAGVDVLTSSIKSLKNRRIIIRRIIYLVQNANPPELPADLMRIIEVILLSLDDPTNHEEVYREVQTRVLPRINVQKHLHINVSPGTPAMHSVWLILHAGGRFPGDTRLWSSQYNPETKRHRIAPVRFPVNTYLAEIRRFSSIVAHAATYEPEPKSPARKNSFERLKRYAQVSAFPLLILGEKGVGKTRLVESFVKTIKQKKVVSLACGGLTSELADSLLFGHRKGAFTGADEPRDGLLKHADGGILFLDEVQDLSKTVQRKLVRVFQDNRHRYRPLGSDEEISVDVELVCATNQTLSKLSQSLDPDLFDRISQLRVEIPPLRDCREDILPDWQQVWGELRQDDLIPKDAPVTDTLMVTLRHSDFHGNLRDLQRLAALIMAWWSPDDLPRTIETSISEWERDDFNQISGDKLPLGTGSRSARIKWFKKQLACWAKDRFTTWKAAAKALECDEKTLRQDVNI